MTSFKKIVGINLLLLLGYSLIIRAGTSGTYSKNDASLGILMFSAVAVGLHVVTSLIIALMYFSSRNRESGRAWLATSGLVLLVGFSVCLGNAAL